MTEATRRIGEGDFSSEIPETGPQEIAHLARKLNEMENQINRLLENRTTLLAGISHDLRTPLARIRLELAMIRGEENRELIDGIQHDTEEMDRLISQTLLLARGLGQENRVGADINALILEVVDDFRKGGNDISYQPVPPIPSTVRIGAFKRALTNLIENAVRYGEGKEVSIECGLAADRVDIRIMDRGPGIPEDQHEAVFQPFFRIDDSRNRQTGGSGLGLSIVRQLCQANGWEVGLSSPPTGGTTFHLQLPVQRAGS
jgi:two-component system osmolarity sensor histidine kinase EnvZ